MNNFVIDTPDNFWQIRWLDKYMEGHKGFIAGGCFKNILFGERVKDIDIFFESESDFQEAVDLFNDKKHQKEGSNAFWIKRIDNLLKYYRRNCITLTESSFEYTVLMDEPDRNLDIDNIMQIHNVLSFHKPQTQIIAIIHNPALIYKLSKLDCVNFIEMTEGYLNKTCTFVSN